MVATLTDAEKRTRLAEVIAEFDTAMLVTRTTEGTLRSRPLSIVHSADDPNRVYFSTAVDSPKVQELEADQSVNVCMQSRTRFASLTGRARVVRDQELIDKLWSETWRVWFPGGKEDPSLYLVIVEPSEGTYWDMSGTRGVRYALDMAKAYVSGTKAQSDSDERHSARVKL
jgi:general stress protein 26